MQSLMFQRFMIVSQCGDLSLEEVLQYKLCPYPPSLFEAKNRLRKPDKPALVEVLRKRVASVEIAVQTAPKTEFTMF